MYARTIWFDEAVENPTAYLIDGVPATIQPNFGTVYQQGTAQDETHFNNMEDGIADAHIAANIRAFGQRQEQYIAAQYRAAFEADVLGESQTVTLTNTGSYPFNSTINSPVSVALTATRKNLFYDVETTATASTGEAGEIHIIDKALNGFKVFFDGAGKSVTILLRIKGGMA